MPSDDQLIVEVLAAGICGTDIQEWTDGPLNIPRVPHPLTGKTAPLTLGHEVVGRVVRGGESTSVRAGSQVAIEVNRSCRQCAECRAGDIQLCAKLASSGLHDDGGLAEYIVVDEVMCLDAEGIPPLTAAVAEPLAVAVRTCRRGHIDDTTDVVILGGGAIGLLCAQVATSLGGRVLVVDPLAKRRELASAVGAHGSCDPAEAATMADRLFGQERRRVVIEAAGTAAAMSLAVALAPRGGTVVIVGVTADLLPVSSMDLAHKELTLVTSLSHVTADFAEAVGLLRTGDFQIDPLISDVVPLSEAISAFEMLRDDPGHHMKVLIVPDRVWDETTRHTAHQRTLPSWTPQ